MLASKFAEILMAVGVVLGALLFSVSEAGSAPACIGYALCIGAVVWYCWHGWMLKGWVGKDYAELRAEDQRLYAIMGRWTYPDGSIVPMQKRRRIHNQWRKVAMMADQHPNNPDNKPKTYEELLRERQERGEPIVTPYRHSPTY